MKLTPSFSALFVAAALAFPAAASAAVDFRFEPVSPGIFRGNEPQDARDYDALQAAGVRTVLSMEVVPTQVHRDRVLAESHGMRFISVPMLASFRPPQVATVTRVLDAMNARELRPIFVHCFHGQDRTGLVVALHRVHAEGWAPEAAWREWVAHHYNPAWYLSGLLRYFVQDTGFVPPGAPVQAVAPVPDSFPPNLPVAPPAQAFFPARR